MRFNIDGKLLQQQLSAVNKVINSKNALTILDNFLFELNGNELTITGSDQENTVRAKLEVLDCDGTGQIAVNAKTLLEITKEISNQPVNFSLNEQTGEIELQFLNGQFKFMGINADEYPKGDSLEEEAVGFSVPASVILKGIENTVYAVSQENIRPIMTGIYWDIHENDIVFVASDTHKLVRYITREVAPGFERGFIMPSKPANILKGIIGKEDMVNIRIGEKGASFSFGDFSLTCRFIKGNYPNYNRVIPTDNPFVVNVDRQSMLNAMRRVAIFASKASNLVKMEMQQGMIRLAAQDLDYGTSAEERVMCDYQGNDMTIGFNSAFTVEILNNMGGDTTIIKLSDPARPGIFEPLEQEPNTELTTIQMPMQVIE
ncbi:MAG: DNA polymerase III subunit beta [Muribaculaceae bacterium]|nr:DNA polymerase III subunit beta [Muribaculaceae bacterium]